MTPTPRLAVHPLEERDLPAAAFETLPIFPFADAAALDTARAVAVRGFALGRRADVFMKVGDSNTDNEPFAANGYLTPLGAAGYDPGAMGLAALGPAVLDAWATFRAPVDGLGNSFTRPSAAARPGFSTADVLANLAGEIAATNAGMALVMIGTNDATRVTDPGAFRTRLTQIVGALEAAGVVPVLSTIPDHLLNGGVYRAGAAALNQVIADVAGDNHVPLWNLFRQLQGLPNAGLDAGGLHLSTVATVPGDLTAAGQLSGQGQHNLGALEVLAWYRQSVVGGGPEPVTVFNTWTPVPTGDTVYAVGRGVGQQSVVSVFDRATGTELDRFRAYEPTFAGGVSVAVADVDGDGRPDVVTAPGPGGGPVVKVFSGADGSLLASFFAFEPSFRTGVNVAAADLDGDGKAEVIAGAGDGGGPAVAVYHGGDLREVARFFAYESTFRGGVNVAAADVAGFGPAIITGSGVGGGPVVKVFRYGETDPAAAVFAYDPGVRDGVRVAAGDVGGDHGVVVTAPAANSSHVKVLDPATWRPVASFYAAAPDALGGVRLAARGGRLLVANGTGGSVSLTEYTDFDHPPLSLPPTDPARAFGVFVG